MKTSLFIAWRYLFSKKGHHAINIVSGISAAAVAVIAAAMICVLSVMNGFGALVEQMFSAFDPDYKVVATSGQPFSTTDPEIQQLLQDPSIELVSEVVERQALIQYRDHQLPAILMGVDTTFAHLTQIDSIITNGKFLTYDGAFERIVFGRGLASTLGVRAQFIDPIRLYAPKLSQRSNLTGVAGPTANVVSGLTGVAGLMNTSTAFISGEFAVNQSVYDDKLAIVSLPLARRLFDLDSTTVTSLYLKCKPIDSKLRNSKTTLNSTLSTLNYKILNRYEQQSDFFRVLKVEKLLTAILLVFILLIAGLNMISSLAMLILDKQQDTETLRHLGADEKQLRRIFLYEGYLINGLGALIGIVIGLALCLAQQHWGLLKLGTGTEYIISAYPVVVQPLDILFVLLTVIALGWLTSHIPTKKL
ncbi:MAG: FtsX-like permease family protein [Paludibacteraceae bacterium]|nr:FtsX-like permease family protein [Paludibacteraceae bacterium]